MSVVTAWVFRRRGVVRSLLALFVAVTVAVAAADPVSGAVGGRPVAALHVNQDRDLVDVVVADAAGRVGTVHTTGHHRFWSESDGRWVRADRLGSGDRLDSGDGSVVTVVGSVTAAGLQTMYDLTVDGVHTYYVQAGDHPVLVHNCGDGATKLESGASSATNGARLNEQLRLTEKYGVGAVRELPAGRMRFYGETTAAKTPGEMAGARLVREWDPAAGVQRTWYETLDQDGNIRIVRPETGGSKVHYSFGPDGSYGGSR